MGNISKKSGVFVVLVVLLGLSGCLQSSSEDNIDSCIVNGCGANSSCDIESDECVCDEGYEWFGKGCVPANSSITDGDTDSAIDLCANINCPAPAKCELFIECNPLSGKCETIFSEEGASCSDDNYCNGEEFCNGSGECLAGNLVECGINEHCDSESESCLCNTGFQLIDDVCEIKVCQDDSDCDDLLICNGIEQCNNQNQCETGKTITCNENAFCSEPDGTCLCSNGFKKEGNECIALPSCPVPQAVTMIIIHQGATIEFSTEEEVPLATGTTQNLQAEQPDEWQAQSDITFSETGKIKVFAKADSASCVSDQIFSFIYDVRETYPAAAGAVGSSAISKDDDRIVDWASGYVSPVEYGTDVIDSWQTPDKALGQAVGGSTDIVSVGRGGNITLTFDNAIKNGIGWDFLVFENSFSENFLELAYVEVSSDGISFARFDNAYLSEEPVSAFGYSEAENIGSLAGKYKAGFGTPFDLEALKYKSEVLNGTLDLNNITHVKIVDIIGGTSETDTTIYYDSFSQIIYDPYPTVQSAGFDLDAVGVIHN